MEEKTSSLLKKARIPFWIFTFAFFPMGLGGFILGIPDVIAGFQSRHWIATPGYVLSSERRPQWLAPDQPEVRYHYTYQGQAHVSNRLWPGQVLAWMPLIQPSESRNISAQFPAGAQTIVYVNPSNPDEAAIYRGPMKALRWMIIFTSCLVIGIWSPLALRRIFQKNP